MDRKKACLACFPQKCDKPDIPARRVFLTPKNGPCGAACYNLHADSDEEAVTLCKTLFSEEAWEVLGVVTWEHGW